MPGTGGPVTPLSATASQTDALPHPHPHSSHHHHSHHPLTHAPRTGSPLARRIESPVNRVQFADDPAARSRSPSIERLQHPGLLSDMPSGLSTMMAARAGSPSLSKCVTRDVICIAHASHSIASSPTAPARPPPAPSPLVPPWVDGCCRSVGETLQRGKSHAKPCLSFPRVLTSAQDASPRTSSSRLTIVRVPGNGSALETTEEQPTQGPFGGSGSFRERSHTRRSSWGANSGTSSDGEGEPGPGGRKRSRMSFAFSSFTPIAPIPSTTRTGPPQRAQSPGTGPGFASSFGPAQGGRARTRSTGSNTGSVDLSAHNPTQDRSGARAPQLSAQQLYDLAMASRDPAGPNATPPVPGVSTGVEPAHFTALPQGEILPFLDRPKEVEALITTPGTQSHKLFALLGALFPRRSVGGEGSKDDGATPKNEPTEPMWPPLPGEEKLSKEAQLALSPPPLPPPSSKAAPPEHPLGLPPQPTQWTYAQLVTHLTQTTRAQLPDKEWVLFARACIRARSEALWERVKGSLGVPSDIYEDDEQESEEEEDDDVRHVGISELSEMSPVIGFRNFGNNAGSEPAGSDEEHEPEAWVEPVFPNNGGPGSARGSVTNSPTHYFAGGGGSHPLSQGTTGLGGGGSDAKSWAGSVSGRSDGGRMELIGEEEEEEEDEDEKDKDSTSGAGHKTPEPDSPMVGLRILTAPMSPGYHPAQSQSIAAGSGGVSPGFHGGGSGAATPSGMATAIPVGTAGIGGVGTGIPGNNSGTASPAPASPTPSIHQFLSPPLPAKNPRAGAWVSPLSNTISTGGRGLSGMGGRSGWNSSAGGRNSPISSGGGWNSPLSSGGGGGRDAWNPMTERGPGNPLFPSSFARLSLGPTLSAK